MPWFKKKSVPFDEHFTIGFHYIHTPPHARDYSWSIPDTYYAELIGVRATFHPTPIGASGPHFVIDITRGGKHLFASLQADSFVRNRTQSLLLQVGSHDVSAKLLYPHVLHALPSNIYLYPGDLLYLYIASYSLGDYLDNITFTMKQWWIN